MPVPYGYGEPSLDFVGCFQTYFFAIEAKAPGKKLTARQELTVAKMKRAGAAVFVVDGKETFEAVDLWFEHIRDEGSPPQ